MTDPQFVKGDRVYYNQTKQVIHSVLTLHSRGWLYQLEGLDHVAVLEDLLTVRTEKDDLIN